MHWRIWGALKRSELMTWETSSERASDHLVEIHESCGHSQYRERRLTNWADPERRERDQINGWDDGRGIYFDDPNGHLQEVITRPYGSRGTGVSRTHPSVARTLDSGSLIGPGSGRRWIAARRSHAIPPRIVPHGKSPRRSGSANT